MTALDPTSAAWLSVKTGLWCVVLGAPFAVTLGWFLARSRFSGKSVIGTFLIAPMVLPPVVTGLILLRLFGRHGFLGQALAALGVRLPFTFAAVVVAALVVGLPFYIMSVRNAFEAIDPRYEELAYTLGHSRWKTFFKVSLPLALPGIFAGALLAFARALGEFGATVVLAGNLEGQTRTLSLAIYSLLDSPDGEAASEKLLWISLAFAFAALALYDLMVRWQRRRLEIEPG